MRRTPPALFLIALAGCEAASERPPDVAGDTSQADARDTTSANAPRPAPNTPLSPAPAARPQQKTDSVRLEGTWERMTFRLVQSPSGFEVPFSTYMPPDMVFQHGSASEGDGFYFYANFGGVRNDNAFLLVFVLPASSSERAARQLTDAFASSRNAEDRVTDSDRYTWSLYERALSFSRGGQRYSAHIALGRHGRRYFYVAQQYPVEYGDGFGPRAQRVLQEWRWLDTNTALNDDVT